MSLESREKEASDALNNNDTKAGAKIVPVGTEMKRAYREEF